MTYGTMEVIQTITVGSGGAASIEFTNIPGTFDDLLIKISARSNVAATNDWGKISFNGSTTSFTSRDIFGDGGTVTSLSNTHYGGLLDGNNATASTFGNTDYYIPNYAGNTNKSVSIDSVSENNATLGSYTHLNAVLWSNTAAITSVRISPNGGTLWQQHSSATLYGITRVPAGAKATGGVIYDDASYWYHVFTSSGTFTPTTSLDVEYLVVAGGGAGATGGGSGGGAGGFRTGNLSLTATAQTVTIGAGGAGGGYNGVSGGNSVFATITSNGGGGGNGFSASPAQSGGSGGGGAANSGVSQPGGAGNTPSTSPSQGNNGGSNNVTTTTGQRHGGGGGGAGQVGGNGSTTSGGKGGDGIASSISGISVIYAGGGGAGADRSGTALGGAGGTGGGGAGANGSSAQIAGTPGTANTGGGGGGGNATTVGTEGAGASGGSGIVIVRYAK